MSDTKQPEREAASGMAAAEEPIGAQGGETGEILDAANQATPALSNAKAHPAPAVGGQSGVDGVADAPRSDS